MKFEDQVCSLELAKKLKGLGVEQDSYFYWIYTNTPLKDGSRDEVVAGKTLGDSHWELGGEQDTYSAFTVAELGDMLPRGCKSYQHLCDGMCDKKYLNEKYFVCKGLDGDFTKYGDTEADARAKMLVYLLENKLIKE